VAADMDIPNQRHRNAGRQDPSIKYVMAIVLPLPQAGYWQQWASVATNA